MTVICPYCGSEAKLVGGSMVYPHRKDLYHLKFWLCAPCDAFVGTHKDSPQHHPLGTLAGPQLREMRKKAHALFDPKWKKGNRTRKEAYIWLSTQLKISIKKCHIASFNFEMCKKVIRACEGKLN